MKYYRCRCEDIGRTVLELLSEAGELLPDTPCGGRGTCGKCRMRLTGAIREADAHETALLGEAYRDGFRLACLARAEGDFGYEISETNPEIQLDFEEVKAAAPSREGHVLAIDLGTTTVALYLCDLSSGEAVNRRSLVNPQRKHGADVISRLVYAEVGGADRLKEEINNAICDAVRAMDAEDIEYAVVCGNTVMEHLLCGEDARGIAKLPFAPATLFGKEYQLPFCGKAYIAPCVAAYVGGDITLGALACGLDNISELTLYIDIGTNGEIVLASRDRLLCCAAAAGPAFEGGNIDCGMIASEGAVCRVYNKDGSIAFETIGGKDPRGICGSGLIDAVSTLLELEYMDETGRLEEDRIFLGDNIFISQKDIRNLQSAKAAIAAGVRTLCHEMKCEAENIERVIIAGGFGSHINAESARNIGLIPYGCEADIAFMGNCAGMGAVELALDFSLEPRLNDLCRRMEYIELSGHKKFNEYYIDEMYFEE